MSLSQLLGKQPSVNIEKQPKEASDDIYNPDIPDEKTEISSQYYKIFKAGTAARNGSGFTLGKKRIYENDRRERFSKTGSIDPSNIASLNDPDYVPPTLKTEGKFSLTDFDIKPPKNQVGLLKQAHTGYLNYLNRFSPDSMPQENQMKSVPEYRKTIRLGMKRN